MPARPVRRCVRTIAVCDKLRGLLLRCALVLSEQTHLLEEPLLALLGDAVLLLMQGAALLLEGAALLLEGTALLLQRVLLLLRVMLHGKALLVQRTALLLQGTLPLLQRSAFSLQGPWPSGKVAGHRFGCR